MLRTRAALPVLQIFAKYPTAGMVKTRLHEVLSPVEAAELHASLVRKCVKKFTKLPAHFRMELWGDSSAEMPFYRQLLTAYPRLGFRLQKGKNLGERMAFAFQFGLLRHGSVILIGTDCPDLDCNRILQVEEYLAIRQLELVAAEDGGYVLIAGKSFSHVFFSAKDWGTSSVLKQTLNSAYSRGWKVNIHGYLWDIDTKTDYRRYRKLYPNSN